MQATRRQFLSTLAAPAWAAAQSAPRQKIVSVEATPVNLWSRTTQGVLPRFSGPADIQRWRYSGPFAQLASALVVTIKTDQGVVGHGLGGGGAAGKAIVDGHLKNLLLGMNPLDIELLWDQMYSSGAMYGRKGLFVMALSGVDNALWDVAGKTMNQPVYRLLGGATKERVPSYFTSGNPEEGLKLGFEHFKLPVRDGVHEGRAGMDRTVGILREARQTIGPDRSLMIDVLLKWDDVAYTKEMARRLEDVRLYFIEEPLSPDNILGYAELCRDVRGTLIASGEHEYTHYGFELLFHHNAVQVAQPDPTWSGGVTSLRKIGAMAAARGVPFIPHRGGSLYGLPLVLSAPNAPLAESFGTGDAASDLMLAMTANFDKGYYLAPEGPGFGTQVTEELIRKHARA